MTNAESINAESINAYAYTQAIVVPAPGRGSLCVEIVSLNEGVGLELALASSLVCVEIVARSESVDVDLVGIGDCKCS